MLCRRFTGKNRRHIIYDSITQHIRLARDDCQKPNTRLGSFSWVWSGFLNCSQKGIKKKPLESLEVSLWRRRRDLNPRYPFGVYTISNRARSASYATSPYEVVCNQLAYNTLFVSICQALFSIFFNESEN